ncbi:unnamed protein product, partial [Rotaria sp. Silwood1]
SAKRTKFDNIETSSSKKNDNESLTIQKYLEMDIFDDKSGLSTEEQSTENRQTILNNAFEGEKIRLEIEPISKFRGRTAHDFKPEKAKKRDGEPSKARASLTREIHGYTYINSYFKFQVHPTDPQSPNLNPRYIFLDTTIELKVYSEILQQLKLQLVVAMLTNKELMQSEQPLKIFARPKNDNHGKFITTKYDNHKDFKEAYSLHDLRFAITLWRKRTW